MKRFVEGKPKSRTDGAGRLGATYDEAVELQASLARRWGLDDVDLQRMAEIQERLIGEIDALAPEQARHLRDMLQTLTVSHHVCLIQVSGRTQRLVFDEFMRRVGEML